MPPEKPQIGVLDYKVFLGCPHACQYVCALEADKKLDDYSRSQKVGNPIASILKSNV